MISITRYTRVAIILHWMIAILILANLALGWWMHEAIEDAGSQSRAIAAFQWHKSLGLTVLGLLLVRVLWRLTHKPPALDMPHWQQRAASLGHLGLYGLMLVLPLSGWLLVSTQWRGESALTLPTLLYGRLEIPHLLALDGLDAALRQSLASVFGETHEILAWLMALLAAGHAGMALQHQFVARDGLLARMQPTRGAALVVLAGVGLVGALLLLAPTRAVQADIRAVDGGWPMDAEASEIAYIGRHAGVAFRGRFSQWSVNFQPDESDLSNSVLEVFIHTASAGDGDPLHDETLREGEWFDVTNFPRAGFSVEEITPNGDGSWTVRGKLTIKELSHAVQGLQLRSTATGYAIAGKLTLDRADFDIGMESDPSGEWVSRAVTVEVKAEFQRPE